MSAGAGDGTGGGRVRTPPTCRSWSQGSGPTCPTAPTATTRSSRSATLTWRSTVSTVDDLDLAEGPVTVVLAMSDLFRSAAGGRSLRLRQPERATTAGTGARVEREPRVTTRPTIARSASAGLAAGRRASSSPRRSRAAASRIRGDAGEGRVLVLVAPRRGMGRLRPARRLPTSTGSSSAAGGRRDGDQRRRPTDADRERLRQPGRRGPGVGQPDGRGPGLRRGRGLRARSGGDRLHDAHRHARRATGSSTCRSPRRSR